MLDINWIRQNPEELKKIILHKCGGDKEKPLFSKTNVDNFLEIDKNKIELIKQIEVTNRRRNEIAELMKSNPENKLDLIHEGKLLKEKVSELDINLKAIELDWNAIYMWFPNIMHKDMPIGKDSDENVEEKAWRPDIGYFKTEELGLGEHSAKYMPKNVLHSEEIFDPVEYAELSERLSIIDTKQSAIVSGSRFCYILKDGAKLQYALQNYILDELINNRGFEIIIPPLLVKERALFGSSHFPGDQDQVYSISGEYLENPESKLFLVGSSEPSNFAYYMDKIISNTELPRKMVAITTCFRSEVGSWGKDVKGIKRVHQFDKLEMDVVCSPEQSEAIHQELLNINEWMLQTLKLPYHIINMCSGDAGYAATAKKYDFEVWLPSQQKYMELGSNTNAFDYQARRYNIKLSDGRFAHTVNDTGVAFGRAICAIIDNYQQKDGSIKVPEVLVKYMKKDYIK